jgi:hypothetical protein
MVQAVEVGIECPDTVEVGENFSIVIWLDPDGKLTDSWVVDLMYSNISIRSVNIQSPWSDTFFDSGTIMNDSIDNIQAFVVNQLNYKTNLVFIDAIAINEGVCYLSVWNVSASGDGEIYNVVSYHEQIDIFNGYDLTYFIIGGIVVIVILLLLCSIKRKEWKKNNSIY